MPLTTRTRRSSIVLESAKREITQTFDRTENVTRINYVVIYIGVLLSFVPLFRPKTLYGYYSHSSAAESTIRLSIAFRESAISCMIVVLVSFLDIIVDFILFLVDISGGSPLIPASRRKLVLVRLTDFERFLFAIGVALVGFIVFYDVAESNLYLIWNCLMNASTILTICPVLLFLERCTQTWTPIRTSLINLLIVLGSILDSASIFDEGQSTRGARGLLVTTDVVHVLCLFLMTVTCSICAITCLRQDYGLDDFIRKYFPARIVRTLGFSDRSVAAEPTVMNQTADSNRMTTMTVDKDTTSNFYRNVVPALHMCSMMIFCILNVVYQLYSVTDSQALTAYNYVNIVAASVVFVVENRIRKNELVRALLMFLEAKKTYVRYISHGTCNMCSYSSSFFKKNIIEHTHTYNGR